MNRKESGEIEEESVAEEFVGQVVRKPTPSGARKVPPNPDAPPLKSKKTQERVAAADQKSAEAYDELELAQEKIVALKEEINAGTVQVELEMSDTAVHRLKNI